MARFAAQTASMSHALTLALMFALVMHAAWLCHVAAAGWAAMRRLTLDPSTLLAAPLAAAVGMALLVEAVTAGIASGAPRLAGWLAAAAALFLALLLQESTRTGRLWRATGANAPGLVASGVPIAPALPLVLGLLLAILAGVLAPPPAVVDWLPLAGLVLLALALPDRPRGRATQLALAAWLAGLVFGSLELMLPPLAHAVLVALLATAGLRTLGPRLARSVSS
jgi:hypothetical protein